MSSSTSKPPSAVAAPFANGAGPHLVRVDRDFVAVNPPDPTTPAESQTERRKVYWQVVDVVGKLAVGLLVIPMFIMGQQLTRVTKAEENRAQEARAHEQRRLGEAELARGLIPSLLKGGSERDLALMVMSWVAPDAASSMVNALHVAGAPFPADVAARARATGANRKLLDLLQGAAADARARMIHDNHAGGYRAFRNALDAIPDWLMVRLGQQKIAAAAAAYDRGDFENAARLLDEALSPVLLHCSTTSDCVEPTAVNP